MILQHIVMLIVIIMMVDGYVLWLQDRHQLIITEYLKQIIYILKQLMVWQHNMFLYLVIITVKQMVGSCLLYKSDSADE